MIIDAYAKYYSQMFFTHICLIFVSFVPSSSKSYDTHEHILRHFIKSGVILRVYFAKLGRPEDAKLILNVSS